MSRLFTLLENDALRLLDVVVRVKSILEPVRSFTNLLYALPREYCRKCRVLEDWCRKDGGG